MSMQTGGEKAEPGRGQADLTLGADDLTVQSSPSREV